MMWYDAIRYFIGSLLIIVFVYALVRGASFAYFRSKYEHFKATLHDLQQKKED